MENCKVCGDPLRKEERTEHYSCRQVKRFKKNGPNTAETRRKIAFKAMVDKPNVFQRLFR